MNALTTEKSDLVVQWEVGPRRKSLLRVRCASPTCFLRWMVGLSGCDKLRRSNRKKREDFLRMKHAYHL